MAAFDSLIAEIAGKYGLRNKSRDLVEETIRFITSVPGGLAGFLDRLNSAGLGHAARTWLGATNPPPMAIAQVEQGLGARNINMIAGKLGLPGDFITPALGCLIPRLVGMATPGGIVPSATPASWKSFIDPTLAASLADIEPARAVSPRERQTQLLIAASLLCLLVIGLWLLSARPERVAIKPPPAAIAQTTAAPAPSPTPPSSEPMASAPPAPAPLPQVTATIVASPTQAPSEPTANVPAPVKESEPPAQLAVPQPDAAQAHATPREDAAASASPPPIAAVAPAANSGLRVAYNASNYIKISGVTQDEASRAAILDAIRTIFGSQNVTGDIAIDANVAPAPWLANLKPALEEFKITGLSALFEGSTLRIGGLIADSERDKVIAALKEAFASEVFVERSTEDPNAKAQAAFKSLKSGFGTRDAADALNLMIVHFPSGSADIPAYNQVILKEAAAVLKQLPADAAIEIQGHTDRSGKSASNRLLSQKRAEAVRAALVEAGVPQAMLTAKGYGSSRPKASNDAPEGRFENRRIEFGAVR